MLALFDVGLVTAPVLIYDLLEFEDVAQLVAGVVVVVS